MNIILALMVAFVLGTVGFGVKLYIRNENMGKLKKTLIVNVATFVPLAGTSIMMLLPKVVYAATTTDASAAGWGFLAAALSTGLASIGAGYAVGVVASAALGAVSEDEKILGKTLIFVGLAEGIAIYGLIVSILILGRI